MSLVLWPLREMAWFRESQELVTSPNVGPEQIDLDFVM